MTIGAATDGSARRRTHTTYLQASPSDQVLNPLLRLTMRRDRLESDGDSYSDEVPIGGLSEQGGLHSTITDLEKRSDSFFHVDTDEKDSIRHTDEEEELKRSLWIPPALRSRGGKTARGGQGAVHRSRTDSTAKTEMVRDCMMCWDFTPDSSSDVMDSSRNVEVFTPVVYVSVGTQTEDAKRHRYDTDQDREDDALLSSSVELLSNNAYHEPDDTIAQPLNNPQHGFDECDDFDAVLGDSPPPTRSSSSKWQWSFSRVPSTKLVTSATKHRTSSRITSLPPHRSGHGLPSNQHTHAAGVADDHNNIHLSPVAEPLRHGQRLHLAFRIGSGVVYQVSGQDARVISNVFSRRVECFPVTEPFPDPDDSLFIIAHTTDGPIRGGERVSIARRDGMVLRVQKMSRKLAYSRKVDRKAKFVVTGVPVNSVVTDTTQFSLQSVLDRSKTIAFTRAPSHLGLGHLALHSVIRTPADDVSLVHPVRFFRHQ